VAAIMTNLTIDAPWRLIVAAVVIAALITFAVLTTRRRRVLLAGVGLATRQGVGAGVWLSVAGLAVLGFGSAGPTVTVSVPRHSGTLVIAMDVSNSMGATDVNPDRLTVAKQAADALIAAQPASIDIGVVAFHTGGLATLQPSADHTAATQAVDRLSVSGGTSIAHAITTALSAITGKNILAAGSGTDPNADPAPGSNVDPNAGPGAADPNVPLPEIGFWPSAAIVLVSDGQDQGGALDQAVSLAQNAGVRIHTIGVGTTAGTSVTVDGVQAFTALDEATLQAISQTTDGTYAPASDTSALDGIAHDIRLHWTAKAQPLPLAGAASGMGLVLLVLSGVLTLRRTGRLI
jgi:Ca-activated chloride channel family protein